MYRTLIVFWKYYSALDSEFVSRTSDDGMYVYVNWRKPVPGNAILKNNLYPTTTTSADKVVIWFDVTEGVYIYS